MKLTIAIPTYNRKEMLESLVMSLIQQGKEQGHELNILIFQDSGENVFPDLVPTGEGFTVHIKRYTQNHGKKRYWEMVNDIFKTIKGRANSADYYLYMADDHILKDNFFNRCIDIWNGMNDPNKICLSYVYDNGRRGTHCWTFVMPGLIPGKGVWRTQWVDMAFFCERNFFDQLQWFLKPIPLERWKNKQHYGSGVGTQISWRLHRRKLNLYHVDENLVTAPDVESVMNPEERRKNKLIAE